MVTRWVALSATAGVRFTFFERDASRISAGMRDADLTTEVGSMHVTPGPHVQLKACRSPPALRSRSRLY